MDRVVNILKQEKILKSSGTAKDIEFYRPKPSSSSATGYKGRIGIFEILTISEDIKNLTIKKASTSEIKAEALKSGMRTMAEDGLVKAAQGFTSIEEVLRVIMD